MAWRMRFGCLAALVGGVGSLRAGAAPTTTIKIGEINSYSGLPSFTEPYRKGWQLARRGDQRRRRRRRQEARGDLQGRRRQAGRRGDGGQRTGVERRRRDAGGRRSSPTSASRSPTSPSRRRSLYPRRRAADRRDHWSKGNRYTFRLRPSNYVQAAMLADEAAKLPAKNWATIAPNYEYGQSAVAVFKELLSARRGRTSNGSASNGRRRARSTPAPVVAGDRRRPSPTRSSTSSSAPTS